MSKYALGSEIKEGTVIAILDNCISSKEKGEKHFASKWYKNEAEAEKAWNCLVKSISKKYYVKIKEKYYPAIGRIRREMIVFQREGGRACG